MVKQIRKYSLIVIKGIKETYIYDIFVMLTHSGSDIPNYFVGEIFIM